MFTTGNHYFLLIAILLYLLGFIFVLFKKTGVGRVTAGTGCLIHFLYLIGRGWISGIFFINPTVEGPYLLPLTITLLAIGMPGLNRQSRGMLLLAALAMGAFLIGYTRGFIPPTPRKQTLWPFFFFLSESLGHTFFYGGAVIAAIFWWQSSRPAANTADSFHPFIVWGFVFFTISQIVGAGWCFVGWGATFHWSPRHLVTAGIWIIYANYIHLHYQGCWNRKRRAIYAILAGLVVLVVTYSHVIHEMKFPRIGG